MVECLPWMREEGSGFNPIHKFKKKKKAKKDQTTRKMCGLKGKEEHSSKFFHIVSKKH